MRASQKLSQPEIQANVFRGINSTVRSVNLQGMNCPCLSFTRPSENWKNVNSKNFCCCLILSCHSTLKKLNPVGSAENEQITCVKLSFIFEFELGNAVLTSYTITSSKAWPLLGSQTRRNHMYF